MPPREGKEGKQHMEEKDRGTFFSIGDTLHILQLIFIVLKCVNLISWSWWVVGIPTWISLFLLLLLRALEFVSGE